jgi:hypothetical protein
VYRWELDGPAQQEFADLPPFGPDGAGLVTFLVCPPDDLVLVVKIQWLGG